MGPYLHPPGEKIVVSSPRCKIGRAFPMPHYPLYTNRFYCSFVFFIHFYCFIGNTAFL